jgi:hypothetical protein
VEHERGNKGESGLLPLLRKDSGRITEREEANIFSGIQTNKIRKHKKCISIRKKHILIKIFFLTSTYLFQNQTGFKDSSGF